MYRREGGEREDTGERGEGRDDNEMIGAGHSQCVSGSNNTFWVSCLPPVHRIFFVSSKLFLLIPHILCLVFENASISNQYTPTNIKWSINGNEMVLVLSDYPRCA